MAGAIGVENGPSPLLWPVAYITACTTAQAVMSHGKMIIAVLEL